MKTTRGMVIVETREHPNLTDVLHNHMEYTNWPLLIVHGDNNADYVRYCTRFLRQPVSFKNIHKGILTSASYNDLLTDEEFWYQMPWDKVLIFQSDSKLLRPGIEQYMHYDFIGAPLYHIEYPAMNGGLSLRDRKAMINCITINPYSPNLGNEDIYFCRILDSIKGKLPSMEIARSFSVETLFGLGSLGVHAIDKWHTPDACDKILNQYK